MEALQFPKGEIYMIICKDADKAVSLAENDPSNYHKARLMNVDPNPQDMKQLFTIEQTSKKEDSFEFTCCAAGMVFDEEKNEIRLKKGKQKRDQLFAVVPANVPGNTQYFWIQTSKKGKEALEL